MENCFDNTKPKDAAGHVHFADGIESHNLIQVKQDGDSKLHAHVGFLQTSHRYEIRFNLPNLLGDGVSPGQEKPGTANLSVVDIQPTDSTNSSLHLVIHMCPTKEGLLKECFMLEDKDKKELSVIIHARVLGIHTGTPMLKDGIHCLEIIRDEESDNDWRL